MIDLYTAPTANCWRASIMLEETGLTYRVHEIDIFGGKQFDAQFLALNPVGKCPVLVDSDGLNGETITLYESMAIVFYLAEKTGIFKPKSPSEFARTLQWASIALNGLGGAFSGLFIFKTFAPEQVPFAFEHYEKEAYRYFKPLEEQLSQTAYLVGNDYGLADLLAFPMSLLSEERLSHGLDDFPNIRRWREQVAARPAVMRGITIPDTRQP